MTPQDEVIAMTQSESRIGPIAEVREGMQVTDAEGAEVGKVELVKMADPDAVTAEDQGQQPPVGGVESIPGAAGIPPGVPGVGAAGSMPAGAGGPGLAAGFVPAAGDMDTGEPDVDSPLAERLLRTGYIKIDSKGWFRSDVYASADQIDRVTDDRVHLNATKAELTPED